MWHITNWNTSPRHYDFTDAGLYKIDATAIESDGVELCNGIELCDWDTEEDQMQLIVCRGCGISGCEPKGWTTFRRTDDYVFWIPLFEEFLDEDGRAADNYSPPHYFRKHGIPYFDQSDYSRFQSQFSQFPSPSMIPPLKISEAMRCIQHDAPDCLLGNIYHGRESHPRLSLILASTEGDHEEWIRILSSSFETDCQDPSPATVGRPETEDRPLSLFPDISPYPEWRVFWLGVHPGYYLAPDLKLMTKTTANETVDSAGIRSLLNNPNQ